jgi:hypothetical protein
MSIPIETLLKRVPRDTLRRVEQAKVRFNTTVRRLLREETALKLSAEATPTSARRFPSGSPAGCRGRSWAAASTTTPG